MSLLSDYFVAPSDEAAAATIDRVGGPGRVAPPPAATRPSLFRRRAKATASVVDGPIYPTVSGGGIEPVVQLGQLEALLTGRTIEEVLEANLVDEPVALRDGGEVLVLKVGDVLTNALTDTSAAELVRVALPWSEIEEFGGGADPTALAEFLAELAELARLGRDRHEALYCWLSV